MAFDLSNILVVGITSRALFNLEEENEIFEKHGLKAFADYQLSQENKLLEKGTAFPLIEALLNLNKKSNEQLVEVVVISKNSPETGLRILHSINHYSLDITRLALTGGENLANYLEAYDVDLFLSKHERDVQDAIDAGCAAAIVYDNPTSDFVPDTEKVRFAFDADAVVFSEESEMIYKEHGLDAFFAHEKENQESPLNEGPFAKLLKILSKIQEKFGLENSPIKIAIVTARNSPAHLRVIKTLRQWGVYADSVFFLGGVAKDKILKAFRPHIFFDDQDIHVEPASRVVPASIVPYHSKSPLRKIIEKKSKSKNV